MLQYTFIFFIIIWNDCIYQTLGASLSFESNTGRVEELADCYQVQERQQNLHLIGNLSQSHVVINTNDIGLTEKDSTIVKDQQLIGNISSNQVHLIQNQKVYNITGVEIYDSHQSVGQLINGSIYVNNTLFGMVLQNQTIVDIDNGNLIGIIENDLVRELPSGLEIGQLLDLNLYQRIDHIESSFFSCLEIIDTSKTFQNNLKLSSIPSHHVHVTLIANDSSQIIISPNQFTFLGLDSYNNDWNEAMNNKENPYFIVYALDDDYVERQNMSIFIQVIVISEDEEYNNLNVDPIVVYVDDNDITGIIMSPIIESLEIQSISNSFETQSFGINTSIIEGQSRSFSLQLKSSPVRSCQSTCIDTIVTLSLYSVHNENDYSILEIIPSKITFDYNDWNIPHRIQIQSIDDNISQGNRSILIYIVANSADMNYEGANSSQSFSFFTSSNSYEFFDLSSSLLPLTLNDMNVPIGQVYIIEDDKFKIEISSLYLIASECEDHVQSLYSNDDCTVTYNISLHSRPLHAIKISINVPNALQARVIPNEIIFDGEIENKCQIGKGCEQSTLWKKPQTINVIPIDNINYDGNRSFLITHEIISINEKKCENNENNCLLSKYKNISIPSINMTVMDNDLAMVVIMSSILPIGTYPLILINQSTNVRENDYQEYYIKLSVKPQFPVHVHIQVEDVNQLMVQAQNMNQPAAQAILTFEGVEALNYQIVRIYGVNNYDMDGLRSSLIYHFVSSNETNAKDECIDSIYNPLDPKTFYRNKKIIYENVNYICYTHYNDIDVSSINVTIYDDDDVFNVILSTKNSSLIEGYSVNQTISLNTRPKEDVLIIFNPTILSYGSSSSIIQQKSIDQLVLINPSQLLFTYDTWNINQTFQITSLDNNQTKGYEPLLIQINFFFQSNYSNFNQIQTDTLFLSIYEDDIGCTKDYKCLQNGICTSIPKRPTSPSIKSDLNAFEMDSLDLKNSLYHTGKICLCPKGFGGAYCQYDENSFQRASLLISVENYFDVSFATNRSWIELAHQLNISSSLLYIVDVKESSCLFPGTFSCIHVIIDFLSDEGINALKVLKSYMALCNRYKCDTPVASLNIYDVTNIYSSSSMNPIAYVMIVLGSIVFLSLIYGCICGRRNHSKKIQTLANSIKKHRSKRHLKMNLVVPQPFDKNET